MSVYDTQTLGALYLQINEAEKALAILDRALALDPSDEPTQINRMKALFTLGQKKEALEVAKKLEKSADVNIANDASALLIAHS